MLRSVSGDAASSSDRDSALDKRVSSALALPASAREEFSGRAQRLWQTTAGLIETGIADGSCRPCDAMATAEIAAGAFFWLPKWRPMGDTAAAAAIADALADIVAFGISSS
jgi:hypothetical protein